MSHSEKPIPDIDEKGRIYISERYLSEICAYNTGYKEPKYNNSLVLNYLALRKIENLHNFSHIKVLHLENNCISRIENISHIKSLRFLFLQNNQIEFIDGLEENTNLVTLNLSSNNIKKISGLKTLDNLENLYIEKNRIENSKDIEEISFCKNLTVVDFSDNSIIDGPTEIVEFFSKLIYLRVLYLKGNEIIRKIPTYRKTMISNCKSLTFLDNKPVDECERLSSEAFFVGGLDEERKVRDKYKREQDRVNKIRNHEKNWQKEETFEERRNKALFSINTEYNKRKDELHEKKKRIVEELLLNPDKKPELSRQLLSVDYQLKENEIFRKKEENDIISCMSKREEVNKHLPFKYEDWMYPIFYKHVIENLFDFSAAVKLIHFDLKSRHVENYQIFNVLDLRMKWTEFELNEFRKQEFDFAIYNIDPKLYEKKINAIINEGVISDNDFENTTLISSKHDVGETNKSEIDFEELD